MLHSLSSNSSLGLLNSSQNYVLFFFFQTIINFIYIFISSTYWVHLVSLVYICLGLTYQDWGSFLEKTHTLPAATTSHSSSSTISSHSSSSAITSHSSSSRGRAFWDFSCPHWLINLCCHCLGLVEIPWVQLPLLYRRHHLSADIQAVWLLPAFSSLFVDVPWALV